MCCLIDCAICQVRVPAKAPIKFSSNSYCRFEDATLSGAGKVYAVHCMCTWWHHAVLDSTMQQ